MSFNLPPPQVNQFLRSLVFALFLGIGLPTSLVLAQQGSEPDNFTDPSVTNSRYDSLKLQQMQLNPVVPRSSPGNAVGRAIARPSCFEPYDTTASGGWTAVPRNDDGFVGPVALGWNFSLFGTIYNSVYINNNGNITFNAGLSTYTPGGFPISTPMVAAFWADVDTRNTASGRAWYKLFPDRLVVTWSYVGYFDNHADRTNTFQLTIKANTAAGFTGNDVLFAYQDMQWTTGDASSGLGGFGGSAATVGVNKGNGTDYIQTGRFNLNNAQAPNIPTVGTPGGVDWLDGQCLGYQVRGTSGNVPPAVAGLPANTTLTLNQGDTRTLSLQFSGPEVNQNVNVTTNLNGLCNTTAALTGNNTTNPTVVFSTTASLCNVGTTNVVFTAVDNGTPSASQAFTLTVVVLPPPNQAPVFGGPLPTQSGTVGTGFSYALPTGTFTDPNNDPLTYSATGLPPGVTFTNGVFGGTPTMAGSFTVTIRATDPGNLSATGTLVITVGMSAPVNRAPVFNGPLPGQSGTVGTGFSYVLPAGTFTDPDNNPLTYSATGLPPGVTFVNGVFGGTPTMAGSFTVTLTATDPGNLSATGTLVITVGMNAPVNGAPVFNGPLPGQAGTVGTGFSYALPTGTFTDPNNDPLTYSATGLPPGVTFTNGVFGGTPTMAGSFTVTIRATDPGNLSATGTLVITVGPGTPVGPGSPFMITAPAGYTCANGAITFRTTGGDGTKIEYRAIGVTDWTTNPNQIIDLAVRNDVNAQPITMQARQSGVMVSMLFDWRGYCNSTPVVPVVPPVVPSGPFSLTTPGSYNCTTGAITFRTVGGNGSTIEYRAIGVIDWTTNPNQIIDLAVRNDINAQPITMQARQSGVMVTRSFDWRGFCNTGMMTRIATGEPGLALKVSVLGNPSRGESVDLEIRGAEGNLLQITVFDLQGRTIGHDNLEKAGAVERRTLPLGRSPGLYYLRVSTPTQMQTVKIIKQ